MGDTFTIADLTVASLLAPLADVEHPDMARPQPIPPRMQELYDRYARHEAILWVRDQYTKHRPTPA